MTSLFTKTAIARAGLPGGTPQQVAAAMRLRWRDDPHVAKAAVGAGSTQNSDWAGPLASAGVAEFVASLTAVSAFYALLANGMRRVPLRTRLGSIVSAPVAHIVAEGQPLPVSRMLFAGGALKPIRAGSVIVVSEELLRAADPAAEGLLETELRNAVSAAVDTRFVSIALDGVTPTAATSDFRADVRGLLDSVAAPGGRVYFIAGQQAANSMTVVEPQGRMTPEGGTFLGIPVIVSAAVATGSIVAVQAASFVAGEDGIQVETSRQGAVEMLDASLQQNGITGTGTELVSLFQTNSVAILAAAWVSAAKIRDNAVAALTNVTWGSA